VLGKIKEVDTSIQALLNSTRPAGVQQGTVIVEVAHEFARSKLSQDRARRLVEDVLSQLLDQDCRVEYRIAGPGEGAIPEKTPPVVVGDPNDLSEKWADDPVVQAAREMGAEVRPIDEGSEG
jgi:hypothetical protein